MNLRERIKTHKRAVVCHQQGVEPSENYDIVCSRKKLGQIFTTATEEALDDFYEYFAGYARQYEILDEAHENFFLAEVEAEVGTDLISVRENLNYSVSGLEGTFSYYSNDHGEANADGRTDAHSANQPAIGAKAYGGRMGNASASEPYDESDGYVFRGGGFFQLTGRSNYQADVDLNADLTGTEMTAEEYADSITETGAGVTSAMAFWYLNNMENCSTIDECTSVINSATDTYAEREQYYQEIAAIPAEGN